MDKEFKQGTRVLLFGVDQKRKSFKRNSAGLENFDDYLEELEDTFDKSNSELDRELNDILAHRSESFTDKLTTALVTEEDSDNLSDCSPKRLSFEELPQLPPPDVNQLSSANKENDYSDSYSDDDIEVEGMSYLSDTCIQPKELENETLLKVKRKRRKKLTLPKGFKNSAKGSENCADKEELVEVGGVKYIRSHVAERDDVTPGVRRSKRKRIAPIQPGEYVEYKHHWGLTPGNRIGGEIKSILKPAPVEAPLAKVVKHKKETKTKEEAVFVTDPVSGNPVKKNLVQPLSSISLTNIDGEEVSPGDDIYYQHFSKTNNESLSSGHITLKKYSEKPLSSTGNNFYGFFIIKGCLTVSINNQIFTANSNSWIDVPPNTAYSIANETKADINVLYVITKTTS